MTESAPEKAPLTGVRSLFDVLRHLLAHGPARNQAELDELTGAVNEADPDYEEPEHVMTPEEKIAAYDKLQAEAAPAAPDRPPAPPAEGTGA